MTGPRPRAAGASGITSRNILSRSSLHSSNFSPSARRFSSSAWVHTSLIGSSACRATRSCTISRGEMRPMAPFVTKRSKSPISVRCSAMMARSSGCRKKNSTTRCRACMRAGSLSGNTIHCRIRLAPIGVIVWSMMSSRLLPPSFIGLSNSRLRTVNLSKRTYRFSSSRLNDVMCCS